MRKLVVGLLASVLFAAFVPQGHGDTAKLALVRVKFDSEEQARFLMTRFDETHNHGQGEIELLLWPGDRVTLDSLGYSYEVVTEDIVARDRALFEEAGPMIELPGPDRDSYRRTEDYNAEMEALAKENPGVVRLFEMPRQTLEGRPVYGLEIAADVSKKDGRPIFYMDGVHHAREWPASEYTMIYAHHLVDNFGKDKKITKLLRRARAIIVPLVNVDGFDYSRESVLSAEENIAERTEPTGYVNGFEGYWRKNRRSLTGVTVPAAQTNPDAYGVDPNRNYAYLWGDNQGGSSGNMFEATYRGSEPFSEPEVANVRDIILNRGVTGVITNHTYQATVLRAGGGHAPDERLLKPIGAKMAKILGYQNNGSVGYPTTGTTDDWAYASVGSLGFTIENGSQGFHPIYEKEVGAFWKEHMKAFDVMLDVSADPRYHSVITGKVAGGKAKLMLTKTFETRLSGGNPTGEDSITEKLKIEMDTDPDGSFEWHVGPSSRPWEKGRESYTLTIKAGGKTKTIKVTVDRGRVLRLGTISL
ncbi:MAG: M14 family zinc carboxypeptidase [Actinomycetota bacterium]